VTVRRPADLSASVHRRLLNICAKTGEDPSQLFARFARERFLYRLSALVDDDEPRQVFQGELRLLQPRHVARILEVERVVGPEGLGQGGLAALPRPEDGRDGEGGQQALHRAQILRSGDEVHERRAGL
jgi:hypothetical protein